MRELQERICQEGVIQGHDIIKVDSFLNHQIDVLFLQKIGQEFQRRFAQERITKILTVEASGIAVAVVTAQFFGVPVVFAKKSTAKNMGSENYVSQVASYTRGSAYDIYVSKLYLTSEDRVLIIDDFLALGNAVLGLAALVEQSGAYLVGAGIVIEKGFQPGGTLLRAQDIRVESLAVIESVQAEGIVFAG